LLAISNRRTVTDDTATWTGDADPVTADRANWTGDADPV